MNPSARPLSPLCSVEAFADLATRDVAAAAVPLHKAEQAAARVRIDLDLLDTRLRVLTEGLSSTSAAADLFRRAAAEAQREREALDTELVRLRSMVMQQEQELRTGLDQILSSSESGADTAVQAAQGVPTLMALHVRQTVLADEMAEVADLASANVDRWRAMLRRSE